jgi:hypothetical protein
MKIVRYNTIFIILDLMFMIIYNVGQNGGMFFKTFLLIWTLLVFIFLLIFTYIFSVFKSVKVSHQLLITYLLVFVLVNLSLASIDPNKIGIIQNLKRQYSNTTMLFEIVIPYLASLASVFAVYYYRTKRTLNE